jgi:ubiquitin C-terminal hydrolase
MPHDTLGVESGGQYCPFEYALASTYTDYIGDCPVGDFVSEYLYEGMWNVVQLGAPRTL